MVLVGLGIGFAGGQGLGTFLPAEATIAVLVEFLQDFLAFGLQIGPAGGFFRFAELTVAIGVILAMKPLKGFLAGLFGGDLFGGIELAVLVGIEPFEEAGDLVGVHGCFRQYALGGGDQGEGEQAEGERTTIGWLICLHAGLNRQKAKRMRRK